MADLVVIPRLRRLLSQRRPAWTSSIDVFS
jgi:hypothetical protein